MFVLIPSGDQWNEWKWICIFWSWRAFHLLMHYRMLPAPGNYQRQMSDCTTVRRQSNGISFWFCVFFVTRHGVAPPPHNRLRPECGDRDRHLLCAQFHSLNPPAWHPANAHTDWPSAITIVHIMIDHNYMAFLECLMDHIKIKECN